MKKFLTMTLMVLGIISVYSQNRSINFLEGKTFAEVKEIAKKENKLIFVDFYTTWCGPCKRMDKEVYINDSVADFYNSHFINIKIDAEKGEGVELRKKYEVKRYPTFIFISSGGEILHRSCSRKTPTEFIQVGSDALNPERQNSKLIDAYKKGNRDAKLVSRLIISLGSDILLLENILPDYLSGQNDTNLFSKENWLIITWHVHDFDSREFQFVFNNKDKFSSLHGDSIVQEKIFRVFSNKFYQLARSTVPDKKKQFDELKEKILATNLSSKDKFLAESDLDFYGATEDWKQFAKVASKAADEYYWNRPEKLNYLAGSLYEHVDDTLMLNKSLVWVKRSIELDNQPRSNDLYTSLLFKLGEIRKRKN